MRHIIFLLIFSLACPVFAQRRGKAKLQKVKTDPRIESMTQATQRIEFIDSVVIPLASLPEALRLSRETGRVCTFQQFFRADQPGCDMLYANETGNRIIYSALQPDSTVRLVQQELYGDTWTRPAELQGLYQPALTDSLCYPFLMADGTTLYFAARGTESIGGLDIFVSRLDVEAGRYMRPENIGMPFNSTANDYLYVIDELTGIGWFATDRRQSPGQVCLYTFLPPDTRELWPDTYTTVQLAARAAITSIRDTWAHTAERKAALARLAAVETNTADRHLDRPIVPGLKARHPADLRSPESRQLYKQLAAMRAKLATIEKRLSQTREASIQGAAKAMVISDERQAEQLYQQIADTEKQIRNLEIKN